jgi:O-antigen ligase
MESQAQTGQPSAPQEGFFNALMDTRFDNLITPSLIRFLYVVAMVIIALGALVFVIAGFAESAGLGLVLLVLAPIGALIYLIVVRLWLELIVVAFKIRDAAEEVASNTRRPTA